METDDKTGRVALVTGASKGIGRVIATRLVADGYRVAGTYRSGDVPEGVLGVRCDVTSVEDVDAAFATVEADLGPVEIVVANAGMNRDTLLMRLGEDEWQSVIDANLSGAYRVAKRASRGLVRGRWGRLIFISSVVGLYGSAGQANYAAAKSGLVGLARSLTRELGGRGITSNVIAPGFIETDMTAELPAETVERYATLIPAGRMGVSEDVAAAVAFLASDEASYINGAVLPVDGGLGMGH
ncbi:MAG: 3-oxoacyl-ACP reductase FabG [Propionibacterium sp.]|nr:3-oxoacyl-ACP reductase FabG [Propionibacterium sp.]